LWKDVVLFSSDVEWLLATTIKEAADWFCSNRSSALCAVIANGKAFRCISHTVSKDRLNLYDWQRFASSSVPHVFVGWWTGDNLLPTDMDVEVDERLGFIHNLQH
jgi:hypothetical protein